MSDSHLPHQGCAHSAQPRGQRQSEKSQFQLLWGSVPLGMAGGASLLPQCLPAVLLRLGNGLYWIYLVFWAPLRALLCAIGCTLSFGGVTLLDLISKEKHFQVFRYFPLCFDISSCWSGEHCHICVFLVVGLCRQINLLQFYWGNNLH